MIIEWLKFRVPSESHSAFIEHDESVWTTALEDCSGYLGKRRWINPDQSQEIVILVHWESKEQWKAIPLSLLEQTEQIFREKMGSHDYEIVEEGEYLVQDLIKEPDSDFSLDLIKISDIVSIIY